MFEKGNLYIRRELHDKYGGNRQGGISNCAKYPFIFVFLARQESITVMKMVISIIQVKVKKEI